MESPEPTTAPADDEVAGVIDLSNEQPTEVVDLTEASPADPDADSPSVDALEDQLGKLQGAMDRLQAGDLDGAERTIEALEQQMSGLRK